VVEERTHDVLTCRFDPLQCLRRAVGDGAASFAIVAFRSAKEAVVVLRIFRGAKGYDPRFLLRRSQQTVAILEATQGIPQRVGCLELGLHLLGLAEERLRLGPDWCRAPAILQRQAIC